MRKCIWMVRWGPRPLLDPVILRDSIIDHVSENTVHVYAILCRNPVRGHMEVYQLGLLFSHVEDLGLKELSQLLSIMAWLAEDGWEPWLEYVDAWWERAIIQVVPIGVTRGAEGTHPKVLRVVEELARDPSTRTAERELPKSHVDLVEGLLDLLYEDTG